MNEAVTYRMVGADGNEYGPVALKDFQAWIKQGRINGSTLVQRSDQGAWSTASSYAELGVVDAISIAPGTVALDAADSAELEQKIKTGGAWFYWIAALSLVNSIFVLSGADFGFVLGLSLTQIIDYAVRELASGQYGSIIKGIAFVLDLAAAGLFVTLGIYARRKHSWAFIAGLIVYGFDTLITMLGLIWLGMVWHGWALYCLVVGLRAANAWRAAHRPASKSRATASAQIAAPVRQSA